MLTGVVDSGPPVLSSERVMHVVIMVSSLLLYAWTIGLISSIEEANNEKALLYQSKMQYVRAVLNEHELPNALLARVVAYLSYQYKDWDQFDLKLLEEMPEGLKVTVPTQRCVFACQMCQIFSFTPSPLPSLRLTQATISKANS